VRINVVGGGPGGLFFAYLAKRHSPENVVTVFEQNGADVTYGFGVVLSGKALDFLTATSPALIERMYKRLEVWADQHLVVNGERIVVDGSAFSGVERIVLLQELQRLCREAGVETNFLNRVQDPAALRDCDLLVAADGANSLVRDSYADVFGTQAIDLQNYYAWYGVERGFAAHTLTFVDTEWGAFAGHHYRYKPHMSTFVPEVDDDTWMRSGMYAMDAEQRQALIEQVFAETLGGKPLISNRTIWRRWKLVKNLRWSHQNVVLIGDALRSAHPSIGSGTRLAMEDSIALWEALTDSPGDVAAALELYETRRKPGRERLNRAAELSIAWYEHLGEKMQLRPYDFAYDYLMRTGVMTPERLERYSPDFMRRYREAHAVA
jgi:2-polyprenyl-6-methoxyphenol hydroxylase-like FAD-dependent oxidoreductase